MSHAQPPTGFPSSGHLPGAGLTYEQLMSQDPEWAMTQGSLYFEDRGKVHESLRRITRALNDLGISYAVAGGMAVYLHGYRRYTDDIDIIVTKESAKQIYDALEGRGYVRPFSNSKNLRDTQSGVRIEFLLSGGFPGDGKPKEIAFPDPHDVSEEINGIRVLRLPTIIGLKLASWMTGQGRGKDLGDVQELIRTFDLPEGLGDELHPYVQEAYRKVWREMHVAARRFIFTWRDERIPAGLASIDRLIELLPDAATLVSMQADGVVVDPSIGPPRPAVAYLTTSIREVAEKYHMTPEEEFLADE